MRNKDKKKKEVFLDDVSLHDMINDFANQGMYVESMISFYRYMIEEEIKEDNLNDEKLSFMMSEENALRVILNFMTMINAPLPTQEEEIKDTKSKNKDSFLLH